MKLVELSEDDTLDPQVPKRPRFFGKVVAVVGGFLVAYTFIGYQVPQKVGMPPTKDEINLADISTVEDVVNVGQTIFFGKGQCALCHSLGAGAEGRCPNLGGDNPVGRKLTREFLYETYTNPEGYVYMDFTVSPPTRFAARMPQINKPPIGLSEPEMLMVHSFLQSRTGQVDISPAEVIALLKADRDKATHAGGETPGKTGGSDAPGLSPAVAGMVTK